MGKPHKSNVIDVEIEHETLGRTESSVTAGAFTLRWWLGTGHNAWRWAITVDYHERPLTCGSAASEAEARQELRDSVEAIRWLLEDVLHVEAVDHDRRHGGLQKIDPGPSKAVKGGQTVRWPRSWRGRLR
jgi:hypothetical protein